MRPMVVDGDYLLFYGQAWTQAFCVRSECEC